MSSHPPNRAHLAHHHHRHGRSIAAVHDHDVLSGRGVHVAQHPGNERFRSLVNTRADHSYCTLYSLSEKRAVAEDIIRHIKSLDPPGRFLRRDGRSHSSRGLNGPWEELSDREAVKKTCQALRDCNRSDRTGYAAAVEMPDDVRLNAATRTALGLTNKQHAEAAVAVMISQDVMDRGCGVQPISQQFMLPVATTASNVIATIPDGYTQRQQHPRNEFIPISGRISPSVENAAEWLKKQRTEDSFTSAFHVSTSRLTQPLNSPESLLSSLHAPHLMNGSTQSAASMPSMEPIDSTDPTSLVYHHDPQIVTTASELFASTPSGPPFGILPSVTTSLPESPMDPTYAAGLCILSGTVNVATPGTSSEDAAVVAEVVRELQGMGADLAEAAANAADAVEAAYDAQQDRAALDDDGSHSNPIAFHMDDVGLGPLSL